MKNLLATLALGLLTASPAMAQSVGLSGMMGGKALIIVDGSPPKTVAVGETYKGVRIVSTQGDQAVIEMSGRQHTLRVGDAPANVGAGAAGGSEGNRIVLTAGSGGHFVTLGQINGKSAQMVIDTGATAVSMGVSDAQRLGIDYQSGQMVRMSTANGVVPGWVIKLSSVRVGNVSVHGIDAVVSSGSMPYVLLGNSFLTHFQMNRSNDQMVLEKRY